MPSGPSFKSTSSEKSSLTTQARLLWHLFPEYSFTLQALKHTAWSGGLDFQVDVLFLISSSKAEAPSINVSKNEIDICSFE